MKNLIPVLLHLLAACHDGGNETRQSFPGDTVRPVSRADSGKGQTKAGLSSSDTSMVFKFASKPVPVKLQRADSPSGYILVLPGWGFPDTQWCAKTTLCRKAEAEGFSLIFVEMGKSVYLASYLPQTRRDYTAYPTRTWLMDTVFRSLAISGVVDTLLPCFVMGLSTGGRGAAMLALEYPGVFDGAASLSGDFDPLLQKNDPLMVNSLGQYEKFPALWKGDNNIHLRASDFVRPIYLGHGKADKVVPVAQSIQFAEKLKAVRPGLEVKTNFPAKAGHDYAYWGSEVDNVLRFFKAIVAKGR